MKSEEAKALFRSGANCAQSVVGVYAKECGLDFDRAMQLSSSFGAGMGRLREVCGAVSGMLMVIGLKEGYCDVKNKAAKDKHYARVQALAAEFKSKNLNTMPAKDLIAWWTKWYIKAGHKRLGRILIGKD